VKGPLCLAKNKIKISFFFVIEKQTSKPPKRKEMQKYNVMHFTFHNAISYFLESNAIFFFLKIYLLNIFQL